LRRRTDLLLLGKVAGGRVAGGRVAGGRVVGGKPPNGLWLMQSPVSSILKPGADRCPAAIVTAPPRHASQEHPREQLHMLPNVLHHPPTENPVQTPSEQSITSILHSDSPPRAGRMPDSPETVNRSSTRRSDSTIPYSTDWTLLESEDNESETKAYMSASSPEPTMPRTMTAPLGHESQSRIGYSQRSSKESPETKQAHHINIISSGSSATASVTSSRSRTQKGSHINGDVNSLGHNRPLAELFPFARARLHSLTYRRPKSLSRNERSSEDFRRQMLKIVFGWGQDIEELIRDECKFVELLCELEECL